MGESQFIKSFMPTNFWTVRNREGNTSMEVFEETHAATVKHGVAWLNNTSQSCSMVAALIASVAYASATTVPGGDNQNTGIPILKGRPAFDTFAIASLVALCFSVTSLTMFLSILTTNYTVQDFLHNLPMKLFISIGEWVCRGLRWICAERMGLKMGLERGEEEEEGILVHLM